MGSGPTHATPADAGAGGFQMRQMEKSDELD